METDDKSKTEQKIKEEPKQKPKNLLESKIACMPKSSIFKIRLRRLRISESNVFPVKLRQYQGQNYVKKYICPKCMSDLEITVKPEKAGLTYYKLILIGFVALFIIINIFLPQNIDQVVKIINTTLPQNINLESNTTTIIEINGIILGIMVVFLLLKLLKNFTKTRSVRIIRLKITARSSMTHKLHNARIKKYTENVVKT